MVTNALIYKNEKKEIGIQGRIQSLQKVNG
jgi:hypothetical protein